VADRPPAETDTEYVVMRDGEVIARWADRSSETAPIRRGLAMSTMAEMGTLRVVPVANGAQFNAVLDSQQEAQTARNLLQRGGTQVKAQANALLAWLRASAPYRWTAGVFSSIGRWISAQTSKMSRRTVGLTAAMVLTSEKGQKALGAVMRFAGKAVHAASSLVLGLVAKPLSWFKATKPAADAIWHARDWVYAQIKSVWDSDPVSGLRNTFRYDGPASHWIQVFARPLALWSLITTYMSGGWMFAALLGTIPFVIPRNALKSAADYLNFASGKVSDAANDAQEKVANKAGTPVYKTPAGQKLITDISDKMAAFFTGAPKNTTSKQVLDAVRNITSTQWRGLITPKSRSERIRDQFADKLGALYVEGTAPFDGTLDNGELAKGIRGQVIAVLDEAFAS
jgi:hypothetical protein